MKLAGQAKLKRVGQCSNGELVVVRDGTNSAFAIIMHQRDPDPFAVFLLDPVRGHDAGDYREIDRSGTVTSWGTDWFLKIDDTPIDSRKERTDLGALLYLTDKGPCFFVGFATTEDFVTVDTLANQSSWNSYAPVYTWSLWASEEAYADPRSEALWTAPERQA